MSDRIEPLKVLAIHAHPDDIEFQCAGTLALLKEKGCLVTLMTMTAGDCGSAELGPEEIVRVRREEARRSAELFGAEYRCLEFLDVQLVHDNRSRRIVTDAIRQTSPDIVITAPPVDYMADHEITSRLVRDACFNAPIPNYKTEDDSAPVLGKIPHLYYVDPVEGSDYFGKRVEPDFIVDITSTFDLKKRMLACHASQREWLLKQHGIDEYLNCCERWSSARGQEIGAAYGEGFTQHKGHPYPADNLLLQLAGE